MGRHFESRRFVATIMVIGVVIGVVIGGCDGDDLSTDRSGPFESAVDSTIDDRPVDSTIQVPVATPGVTTTTSVAPTTSVGPVTSVPASSTATRSETTTLAPDPTTTSTLDEWDVYYPIGYAPGFRLRVTEPSPCDGVRRPAVVSVNSYISLDLVERGFVMVDLRADGPETRTFDARFLQEIADVTDRIGIAVQWLRAHADEYCVAPDAIAVTGYSYGAIAALALAYTDREIEAGDLVVVDLMGPPVVSETRHVSPPAELAGFSNDPDAVVAHAGFAIVDTIDRGEPPVLMFNGRNDPLIPFVLAEQTCAAALAVDIVCEIIAHDEEHAFSEDDREAVDIVVAFLEREMVVPAGVSAET